MPSPRQAKALAVLDDNAQKWQYGHFSCYMPQRWQEIRALSAGASFSVLRKWLHEHATNLP